MYFTTCEASLPRPDRRGYHRFVPARRAGRRTIRLVALVAGLLLSDRLSAAADVDLLEQQAFQAAVDQVAPSVVRIETVGGLEKVGKVLFGTGPTTGLVVDRDGHIISSAFNFINRPTSILVQLPDGTRQPARRVATDHNRMLVLLKIDVEKPLPVPEFAMKDEIQVGQWAIGVGRAFDGDRPNMSVGILSAVNRIWGKAIQADTAIGPNNYGGPLADLRGQVLGVLVPMSPEGNDEVAGFEWYDSGIGFAIPSDDVQVVVKRLKAGKDLHPGVVGLRFTSENLHIAEPVIGSTPPNSPAYRAGLRKDDKIVEIGGRKVDRAAQVKEEISRRYAGDTVALVALRGNERIETSLQLAEKLEAYDTPFLGILPMRTPGEVESPDKSQGVTVRYVYPDSPAAKAGVEAGDVVTSLAGDTVRDAAELRRKVGDYQPNQSVEVELRRNKETLQRTAVLGRLPEQLRNEALPPAARVAQSKGTNQPQTGKVRFEVGGFDNEVWAYIPEDGNPALPCGLVVWLHGSEGGEVNPLIAQWKPHCDRDRVILLVPKAATPGKWQFKDLALVHGLLEQIRSRYTVDVTRVVALGHEDGGKLACLLAFRNREAIRAVALVNSSIVGRPPENDPDHRLAFYLAWSANGESMGEMNEAVDQLREMKYPVSVKDLGKKSRSLDTKEQLELARWIDTLDRI